MRARLAFLLGLILTLLPGRAVAQTCSRISWGETRTRSFVFTYQESISLGSEIADRFGDALDEEFFRFANLFETSLPVPIMVRLYSNEREYYCFNALAPQIPIGATHSHIGGREIALIANNIQADPRRWDIEGLDALRSELAVLYLDFISASKAPEGLQIGLGVYAQDPFVAFERRFQSAPPPIDAPSVSWRGLWESPDRIAHPENELQAASITAYLVDVYGWSRFLEFTAALRTAESWRLALEEVYPASAGALEDQWAGAYYPRYMQGRWRENALYGLSLIPYRQLIEAGAYQAAADGLAEVIALLVDLEDFVRLDQAQAMNARALSGLEADSLARQARQVYLEGDFEAAIDFAAQALSRYEELGDMRNTQSLRDIRARAAEVVELQAELAGIERDIGGIAGLLHGPRLVEIGSRLAELGDMSGAERARILVEKLNGRRFTQSAFIAASGALLAAALVVMRLKSARRLSPPEARLGA